MYSGILKFHIYPEIGQIVWCRRAAFPRPYWLASAIRLGVMLMNWCRRARCSTATTIQAMAARSTKIFTVNQSDRCDIGWPAFADGNSRIGSQTGESVLRKPSAYLPEYIVLT